MLKIMPAKLASLSQEVLSCLKIVLGQNFLEKFCAMGSVKNKINENFCSILIKNVLQNFN